MRIVIFRSFRFFYKMFLQQKADVFALEMWMPLRTIVNALSPTIKLYMHGPTYAVYFSFLFPSQDMVNK
jgi:hypothetical protein